MREPTPGSAVVTGATGFIGWRLAERLRDRGWRVRAIVRPDSRRPVPEGIERLPVPMTADHVRRACGQTDVVFHLAGRTSAPSRGMFDRANVDLARTVAQAARDAGATLIAVSSQAAAGPATADRPRTERDSPAPCSPYGASKLAGEAAVRQVDGLDWTILRPVAVYGPRDRGFYPLFRAARAGWLPTLGDPAAAYQFVHVDDLVRLIERAASTERARHEVCFVGHSVAHRVADVLACLARAVDRPVRVQRVPHAVLAVAALCGEVAALYGAAIVFDRSKLSELSAGGFVCDTSRAADVLGDTPGIDITEGFASTAAWYRRNGWL